jgi:alpha-galactosidase
VVGFRRIVSNSEVGAINKDTLQERAKRVNDDDNNNILAKSLADGEIAIGVFNFGGAATVGVDFAGISNALGRNSGAGASGASGRRQVDLGNFENAIDVELPEHGGILLLLSPFV